MDLTSIPGWESIDFAMRQRHRSENRTGQQIADLILEAYRLRGERATPQQLTECSEASAPIAVDISRIDRYAPAELIGHEAETKLLFEAWDLAVSGEAERSRVMTFVALGGEGKTSLVAKWAAALAYQDWPGCEAVFAWSFYSLIDLCNPCRVELTRHTNQGCAATRRRLAIG